ncbi:hypothetical protein, partial [Massilia pinisoli]|uniref:hypothetical protein n=1 Tax=Massilia pinisoli TaxID=1772194 RepID=UPI0036D3CE2B
MILQVHQQYDFIKNLLKYFQKTILSRKFRERSVRDNHPRLTDHPHNKIAMNEEKEKYSQRKCYEHNTIKVSAPEASQKGVA